MPRLEYRQVIKDMKSCRKLSDLHVAFSVWKYWSIIPIHITTTFIFPPINHISPYVFPPIIHTPTYFHLSSISIFFIYTIWALYGNLWATGHHLMETSYLKANPLGDRYLEWTPNLHSDRSQDSNLCARVSQGPQSASVSTLPTYFHYHPYLYVYLRISTCISFLPYTDLFLPIIPIHVPTYFPPITFILFAFLKYSAM